MRIFGADKLEGGIWLFTVICSIDGVNEGLGINELVCRGNWGKQ